MAESRGFLEAISWARELGLENIIIDGDAKRVVDAINCGNSYNQVFGDYIRA